MIASIHVNGCIVEDRLKHLPSSYCLQPGRPSNFLSYATRPKKDRESAVNEHLCLMVVKKRILDSMAIFACRSGANGVSARTVLGGYSHALFQPSFASTDIGLRQYPPIDSTVHHLRSASI